MKISKSITFFIKSFLLFALLAIVTIAVSLNSFEQYTYNFLTKYFTAESKPASEKTVIIAIDDKSISYHRWPWPREYYGKMIDYLTFLSLSENSKCSLTSL